MATTEMQNLLVAFNYSTDVDIRIHLLEALHAYLDKNPKQLQHLATDLVATKVTKSNRRDILNGLHLIERDGTIRQWSQKADMDRLKREYRFHEHLQRYLGMYALQFNERFHEVITALIHVNTRLVEDLAADITFFENMMVFQTASDRSDDK